MKLVELESCTCGGKASEETSHTKHPYHGYDQDFIHRYYCQDCPMSTAWVIYADERDKAADAWNTMQQALKGNMELAEQREQIALDFLDTLNSNNVISYADYSYLHDSISGILAAAMPEPSKDSANG